MRHAFIVDPLAGLSVEQDTTIVCMREAASRGYDVLTGQAGGIGVGEGGRPYAWLSRTRLLEAPPGDPWFELEPAAPLPLDGFDVVWMRTDPPYDLDYLWATQLLSLVGPPTLVVNDPTGLREVDEKLWAQRFPDLCPETLVSRRIDELLAFREKLGGEMILKPLGGCGGEGVFHLTPEDRNVRAILELGTQHETRPQIAQRYLPEVRDGDKRVIVVEGEPIGAVLRVPRHWESRANFHAGGSAERAPVDDRDREICARIGPELVGHGIVLAGIDVIGPWLTEVNVTSPTGLREINALDGVRLEVQLLDAVERRHASRPSGSGSGSA